MPFASVQQKPQGDRREFDREIALFRAEIANLAAHMHIDGHARMLYDQKIRELSSELALKATRGETSWRAAASEANQIRNITMEMIRKRTTPVGRARAERIKPTGLDLNTMVAKKTQALFGTGADFNRLTTAQQNQVYAEIVKSAGKSNAAITTRMRWISRAGRGLLVLSIGVSVYNVATSETPGKTAVKEGAVLGGGIAGGIAGGAAAGLLCGPGAPVCVTVGAFVGGALAAFGVDYFF